MAAGKVKPELVGRLRYAAETAPPEVSALLLEAAEEVVDLRRRVGDAEEVDATDEELELLMMRAVGSA
ncbi:hypothetical protein [Aureimonas pseudogalii]|uniref:Uncharacterized protein n=1 Tax=Aureimonas pseudogalii TaxID=1744844 RepID=A0A7W6H7Q3_9HYPH|nr:hypothetical protein [Aureimonas pseudogalii]MBB4000143.1 hypothetical protein [Aureimonas pseudogalii]